MDRYSFLGSVHAAFVDELYDRYLQHPDQVEPSWRAFFQGYDFAREAYSSDASDLGHRAEVPEEVRKEFQVLDLIADYRKRGHLFTETNPVRARRVYTPSLDLVNYGLSDADLERPFMAASEVGLKAPAPLKTIVAHLRKVYCQSIGIEFMYIRDVEKTQWIKSKLHLNENQPRFTPEQKVHILRKLNEAVSFENFLNTKFVGQKRFSVEGAESLIPALDVLVEHAAEHGVREVVMGMAHRGRLNVLSNIFGKSQREIFSEFEGKAFDEEGFDGDVKYHLGYSSVRTTQSGKEIRLNLSPNPSHLDSVDPVVEGIARARWDERYANEPGTVLPVLIHGDAAIAGQGVVYEVVQMEILDGYRTGGTIHLVINNQVGFTTNYLDARSSTYCTDLAKVVLAPVLHVNGDDVEAVCHAVLFAVEYRQRFQRNIFIDLLCYRKYGHNEGDEPRFTQPLLYKIISKHPNPRVIYFSKLESEGVVAAPVLRQMEEEFKAMLEERYDESKKIERNHITPFLEEDYRGFRTALPDDFDRSPDTGVDREKLLSVSRSLTTLPENKTFFNKIKRLIEDRRKMVEEFDRIDWGMAELMAYGTLLLEGFGVRLSGEDSERGTFSHRHAIVKVEDSEEEINILSGLPGAQARFEVFNSHLSEYGVLGFDYGYALARPGSLVLWEAQFGDFANGAQIIIDQYLAAAEDKWKVQNGLVLLLPHGYEGQGAEHSSARLERFLQLCAQLNMQVVNVTTPANFFHLLRRQMHRPFRKPLVVMSPKSLLRLPACVSPLSDFEQGRFQEVLDIDNPEPMAVRKLVFCSGKLYYELFDRRAQLGLKEVALVRLEQLYPFPHKSFDAVLKRYSKVTQTIWAQEEPANMGARAHVLLSVRTVDWIEICPSASASPASGSHQAAHHIQERVISGVFNA
ncbi:2-oxoglutarate dehydrogenase E1 component [bacterium]|nr:2-oxoglutarate dehydrogenase E1 component [bacterium]